MAPGENPPVKRKRGRPPKRDQLSLLLLLQEKNQNQNLAVKSKQRIRKPMEEAYQTNHYLVVQMNLRTVLSQGSEGKEDMNRMMTTKKKNRAK